jgi:hypothetical protein
MTVPPRMKPSALASLGSTTWTISVAESAARLGSSVTIVDLRLSIYDRRFSASLVNHRS